MASRPTRIPRLSADPAQWRWSVRRRSIVPLVLLTLLALEPAVATQHGTPPADPPMPDPCRPAPVLPFCR